MPTFVLRYAILLRVEYLSYNKCQLDNILFDASIIAKIV